MMYKRILFALFLCLPATLHAQQDGVLQIRDDVHLFLLNAQTQGYLPDAILSHLPLSAYEAREYLLALDSSLTGSERAYWEYLRGETSSAPSWLTRRFPFLYTNGQDVFSTQGKNYALQINPLLYLSFGRSWERIPEGSLQRTTWQNTRGIRVSGHLGKHIFFESRLEENQTVLPPLARDIFLKRLSWAAERRDFLPEGGLDYWRVTGIVGVRIPFVELRFGRARNKWGPGLSSLLLSDYAPPYDQLQIRTSFWRLQYTNLYGIMTDPYKPRAGIEAEASAPRFIAMHRLALRLHRRLQLGFYESVTLDPEAFRSETQMLAAFLNPIIFYRAVDISIGSPGNMLIGTDWYWQFGRGLAFYGQFLLDEFRFRELIARRGWWGNKWGLLTGLHITRLPVSGTALWVEYVLQRPYLYSNRTTTLSYTHLRAPLGYPTGPNSRTLSLYLTHRRQMYHIDVLVLWLQRGRDANGKNYGSNPIKPYTTRVGDYGISLLQGVRQDSWLVETRAGIELLPRLSLDVTLRYQLLKDAENGVYRTWNPALLLRWGLPYQSLYF